MRSQLLLGMAIALGSACSDDTEGAPDGAGGPLDAAISSSSIAASSTDGGWAGDAQRDAAAADAPLLGAGDGGSDAGFDATDRAMTTAPEAGMSADTAAEAAADASAPSFDWAAGDYPPDLHAQVYLELTGVPGQAGKTRGYKVHVPTSYSPAVPAPVLFAFHGYQQNAVMFVVDGTGFVAKSDQEGFILVMPNGLQEDLLGGSWNAGTCCGEAAAQKLDDVGLVRAIYAQLRKHLNVDEARVYATGLSNGGFMTHRLGCEAADLFAAIAPLAGSIGTPELSAIGTNPDPDLKTCNPAKPIAVLAMHGNGDAIVPYSGMKPSLDHFAAKDGCSMSTGAAAQPASGGDTTCITYAGCTSGVEVTGCTVQDGGHCWFGDASCGTGAPGIGNLVVGNNSNFLYATDAAWAFLKRFRR